MTRRSSSPTSAATWCSSRAPVRGVPGRLPALARGWRTEIGRSLITLDAGLTPGAAPSVLHGCSGSRWPSIGFAWYFVASIAIVGAATWGDLVVIKIQWRGRRKPPEDGA